MALDYELLLKEGAIGISRQIDSYLQQTQDPQKIAFYQLAKSCLSAVEICAQNHANEAKRLAEIEADETVKVELYEIARICERVPKYPARTFHEALQSVHFLVYILGFEPYLYGSMLYPLGHPDRYLYAYYEKDLASGILTKERAQTLIDCLAIQMNHRVPRGLSTGYMVGGRNADGALVQNDLTSAFMQAIDDVRLVYPSVGLCVTHGMDDKYLMQACEILSHGRSHPAIFNDDVISGGLRSYGVTEQESYNYIHSTCVEITPVASSSVWVASPYTNMPQILLDLLAKDFDSFDELLSAYFQDLDTSIEKNYLIELASRKTRNNTSICPLLSCFVNNCLEKGVDIEQGGARYQWIMPSFVGMANLVDSLYALKKTVFEQKNFTLTQMRSMLAANFEGFEPQRKYLIDRIEKYGNDVDDVDALFTHVNAHIISACQKYSIKHGDSDGKNRLIPSVFCWTRHEKFGRFTGATPDGRKAGFPLGDGSGPCQGREKCGPLASVLSSTKWSHKELIGGVAVNMKFTKKTFTSNSMQNMLAIVKTYLERGGFEMQINVVDEETLRAAQQDPESYRDLVVRIGGYSDYFVQISPQMQAEVLLRTTHGV
ncbi:MAG: hypothetical protein IKA88_01155 [Clostridia bacterium]|nr:hypothetical protein [Clostridia bacterium]